MHTSAPCRALKTSAALTTMHISGLQKSNGHKCRTESHNTSGGQKACQITEASHLAVLPDLGLGQPLPLDLTESQGWQVNHYVLPFMNAHPIPAGHHGSIVPAKLHSRADHKKLLTVNRRMSALA